MHRHALATLALAIAVLVPATLAQAARKPTKRERAQIARAVGVPKRCPDITVSKVVSVRSGGKARRYRYASVALPPKAGCRAVDGVAVFKRRVNASRWSFVIAGSAFTCPIRRVPAEAVDDLKLRCDG